MHILHLEDSEDDCKLIEKTLEQNDLNCQIRRVETREEFFDSLQQSEFDLILSDCSLPKFSGMEALTIARTLKPQVPFVFVSGTIGEDAAIESLRNGATDYVLKDKLSRLAPAVRRALMEVEEQKLCHEVTETLHHIRRFEAVSTMAGGISHDFNDILAIILGNAALLKEGTETNDRVWLIADTISQAAQRGVGLVEQLLAFARRSEGHFAFIDLNKKVWPTIATLSKTLPAHIKCVIDLASGLPGIHGDEAQIGRMLDNLIENSLEAMPEGGEITISTRLVPAAEVPSGLPNRGADFYLCLLVTDNGCGMDEETRQHVFEPFYTTKPRGKGTGLGLPVVYGLMQSHRGGVDIQSESGKGTAVSLYFPIAPGAPLPQSDTPTHAPLSAVGTETILVVDDEPELAKFLCTVLRSRGYRPILALSPLQAIQLFNDHSEAIKLVVSDVGLPQMDGFNLCSKLKTLKKDIKTILVSGGSDGSYRAKVNAIGIDAFLPKPYKAKDILACIRETLDRKQS